MSNPARRAARWIAAFSAGETRIWSWEDLALAGTTPG
jgi:hypothetical protein